MSISAATSSDFRKVTAFFDKEQFPYHTYQLEEEKTLKVVLRHIPVLNSVEEVVNLLKERNIPVLSAHRLTARNGRPYQLIYCNVEKSEQGRKIFDVRHLDGMAIKVEHKKKSTGRNQCHRCQLYGHSQANCRATAACVKCAGEHLSSQCPLPPYSGAKCANCDGDHPASFRGCPSYSRFTQRTSQKIMPAKNIQYSERKEGVSYAQMLGNSNSSVTPAAMTSPLTPKIQAMSEVLRHMMSVLTTEADKSILAAAFAKAVSNEF